MTTWYCHNTTCIKFNLPLELGYGNSLVTWTCPECRQMLVHGVHSDKLPEFWKCAECPQVIYVSAPVTDEQNIQIMEHARKHVQPKHTIRVDPSAI